MALNETADVTGRTGGLTESERHRLLARKRRRLAIEILASEMSPTDIETLATEIAAREDEGGATDEESIEDIKAMLHHAHLPKLAEVGIIDYDPKSHSIESTGMNSETDGLL